MDRKVQAWAKAAASGKGKWPPEKLAMAKRLAEKLKKHPEIDNPHALARWAVARGAKVKV